ncbi:hypothetical protein BaRGS_00025987 [Batillaria attramentaria]|uniref:Uncharacterized protein n=1 Tax=Batillaria attramentaria TaxID=370345 RepID=A0ABD0K7G5_9CAEN
MSSEGFRQDSFGVSGTGQTSSQCSARVHVIFPVPQRDENQPGGTVDASRTFDRLLPNATRGRLPGAATSRLHSPGVTRHMVNRDDPPTPLSWESQTCQGQVTGAQRVASILGVDQGPELTAADLWSEFPGGGAGGGRGAC